MTVKRIILILKTCGDSDSSLRPATTSASQDGSSFSRNQRSYDVEGRLCGHLLAASYQLSIAGPECLAVAVTYSKGRPSAYAYTFPNNCTLNLAIARDSGNDGWETGRTYTMGMATVYDWQASHDALGRPSATGDSFSATRSWTYNARSEMIGCTANDGSYSYVYDTIGNRLLSAEAHGGYYGSSLSYIANGLNQYMYVDSTTFVYDDDGNLTSDGQYIYAYDSENRLVSVATASPFVGDVAIENEYDHMNRRVRKTVLQFDGMDWNEQETHSFAWDGWNIVLERIDYADFTTPSRVIEYYWGNDLSGTEQGAGGVGGLLAVSCDGKFYVPIYGGNGNIMGYVDESGTLVAKFVYDPYGNVVSISDDIGNSVYADFRGEDFSFDFSTKYHDREVGLVAYQLRSYSPTLGRWLNRDPIEEEGGINLFAFVGNRFGLYDVLGLRNESCSRVGNFNILKIKIDINPAEREFSQSEMRDAANDLLGRLAKLGFHGSTAGLANLGRILRVLYSGGDYLAKRRAALGGVGELGESLEDFRAKYLKGVFRVDGRLKYQLCLCRKGKLRFVGQEDIVDEEEVDFSNAYELTLYREEIIRVVKSMEKSLLEKLSRKVKEARK